MLVLADHGMELNDPDVTGDWGSALEERRHHRSATRDRASCTSVSRPRSRWPTGPRHLETQVQRLPRFDEPDALVEAFPFVVGGGQVHDLDAAA